MGNANPARGAERGLYADLRRGINCFLDQLIPAVRLSPPLISLKFHQRFESFAQESYEGELFEAASEAKLKKDGLEMLKV